MSNEHATSIIRLEKIKIGDNANVKGDHYYRKLFAVNADPSKKDENITIVDMTEKTLWKSINKRVEECYPDGKGLRSNQVRAIDVIMSYSNQGLLSEDFSQEKWRKKSMDFLYSTFGKENVLVAIEHHDETTPHIHAVVVPIFNGKLNCTHYMGTIAKLEAMQDRYSEVVEELGISRGFKHSVAKNKDLQLFYKEFQGAIQAKEGDVPEPLENESAKQYLERVNFPEFLKNERIKMFANVTKEQQKLNHERNEFNAEKMQHDLFFESSFENIEKEKELAAKKDKELRAREEQIAKKQAVLDAVKTGVEVLDELSYSVQHGYTTDDQMARLQELVEQYKALDLEPEGMEAPEL